MRAKPQAVEIADAEADYDEVEVSAARADEGLIEGRDIDQLVLLLKSAAEPGDRFRTVFDDQYPPRRIRVDHGLSRIGEAHALPGFLAHPELIRHHLQTDKAAHASKQGRVVDRLGEKIIGAGVEAGHTVARLIERGDH